MRKAAGGQRAEISIVTVLERRSFCN